MKNITEKEIIEAATVANAHDFISKFPDGYKTYVGTKGKQLSGGQKQRIAIARAIVRNPKLLLLDEATSALDANSELIVQKALNDVSKRCTTIIIAHRLSTIRNADKIFAFRDGKVVEAGTHEELIQVEGGLYKALVNAQSEAGWEDKEKAKKDRKRLESENNPKINKQISEKFPRRASIKTKGVGFDNEAFEGELELDQKNSMNLDNHDSSDEELIDVPFMEVLKLNSPEWLWIVLGMVSACFAGAMDPLNAMLISEILRVFQTPATPENSSIIWNDTYFFIISFCTIAVVAGLSHCLRTVSSGQSGTSLNTRMRFMYFQATLSQDMEYFDDVKNTPGVICSRLSTDCEKVGNVTGTRMSMLVQNCSALGTALFIGFYFSWEMTLLLLLIIPLLALAGYLEQKGNMNDLRKDELNKQNQNLADTETADLSALEENKHAEVAFNAMNNFRTVVMLSLERDFLKEYTKALEVSHAKDFRLSAIRGISYAFSQSMIFFAYAAAFRLGTYLVAYQGLVFTDMFKVMSAMTFGALAIGQNQSIMPDMAEAKEAIDRIWLVFRRKPKIDSFSPSGQKDLQIPRVNADQVEFTYPSRKLVQVLKGLSFEASQNKTVALVGQSGCGKSTMFQMVQRFYDYDAGKIELGKIVVPDRNVTDLRHHFGLVQQEPVLFKVLSSRCKISLNNYSLRLRNLLLHNFPLVDQ